MFKKRVLVIFLSVLLVFLIELLVKDSNETSSMFTRMIKLSNYRASDYVDNDLKVVEVDTSQNNSSEQTTEEETNEEKEETNTINNSSNELVANISNEEVQEPSVVYNGMTLEELANQLDRSFKNELSGKGYLYASYSLENGVDPYLAAAISLEETGCNWNCSNLVKSCNNVGGMKGTGCGSYGYFNTLDDGIRAFIDNIARNYVAYGLTTAETMNSKYAENPAWASNVNNYISRIKNN